jgi:hypothetical protein
MGSQGGHKEDSSTRLCILSLQLRCLGDTVVGSTSGQASSMEGAASPHRTAMPAVKTKRRRSRPYMSRAAPKYLASTELVSQGQAMDRGEAGRPMCTHNRYVFRLRAACCQRGVCPACESLCAGAVASRAAMPSGGGEQASSNRADCTIDVCESGHPPAQEAPTTRTCSAMSVRSIKPCSA